ncbi:MAG TPA: SRPBCC domain-containing protein [Streptosporangiaceae bacterium]|nr:SRPBCC domain-containing protein [Streptosporangiaceae bacterium]
MKVTGEATLAAPVEQVWAALDSPDLLARAIPGCERLEARGDGRIHFQVTAALPGVAGSYECDAVSSERSAPTLLRLNLAGAGSQGAVDATVEIRLNGLDEGSTGFAYRVDAELDGAIAAVGQRMAGSIARRLADQFVAALAEGLTAPPEEPVPAGEPTFAGAPAGAALDNALGVDESAVSEIADDESAARAGWSGVKSGLLVSAAVGASGVVAAVVLRRLRRAATRQP